MLKAETSLKAFDRLQEVEQQNERTAKELNSMVQQSQEKVMEEVRKRAVLEKDLRQMNEEKARVNEDKAKLNEEKARLNEQQAKLHEETHGLGVLEA